MSVVLFNRNRVPMPAYVGAASIVPAAGLAGEPVRMVLAYCERRADALHFSDAPAAHEFVRLAEKLHARDMGALIVSEREGA